jgi:hypothetical protein
MLAVAAQAGVITYSDIASTGDTTIPGTYVPQMVVADPLGAGPALPAGVTITWPGSSLKSSASAPDHTANNPNASTPPNRYMWVDTTGTTTMVFSADVQVASLWVRPDGNPAGSIGIRGLDAVGIVIWTANTTALTNAVWNEITAGVNLNIRQLQFFDGNGGNSGNPRYAGIDDILVIPEPATLSLLAMGGLAILRRNRK